MSDRYASISKLMTMICMECECNVLEFVAQENYFENKTNITTKYGQISGNLNIHYWHYIIIWKFTLLLSLVGSKNYTVV